jgi:hypothetical protein
MHRLLWFSSWRREIYYDWSQRADPDYIVLLLPLRLGQNEQTDGWTILEVERRRGILLERYDAVMNEEHLVILRKK